MPTVDDILNAAENEAWVRVGTVRLLFRQDLRKRFDELDKALEKAIHDDARLNRDPVAPGLEAELAELEAEIDEAKVPFHFKAIGKRAWADLLARHPPTERQLARIKGLDHNPDSFPEAAIAASLTDPAMTEDQVRRLVRAKGTTVGMFDDLWTKCIDVNVGGNRDPKSMAAGLIRRARELSANSATAEDDPSLEASSSDEPLE